MSRNTYVTHKEFESIWEFVSKYPNVSNKTCSVAFGRNPVTIGRVRKSGGDFDLFKKIGFTNHEHQKVTVETQVTIADVTDGVDSATDKDSADKIYEMVNAIVGDVVKNTLAETLLGAIKFILSADNNDCEKENDNV